MLNQYKQSFFDAIGESGLDPRSFQARESQIEGEGVFEVSLRNSPLAFFVKNNRVNFHEFKWRYTMFGPDFPLTVYFPGQQEWGNGNHMSVYFHNWLHSTVIPYLEDLLQPDPWQQLEVQRSLVAGEGSVKDGMGLFSDDERARLRLALNEFRVVVEETFQPTREEMELINARLEYLSDAVDRLGKIDWRAVALTTLINIATTLALDPDKAKTLYALFERVFTKVIYFLQ
jgi:hypothetical protein